MLDQRPAVFFEGHDPAGARSDDHPDAAPVHRVPVAAQARVLEGLFGSADGELRKEVEAADFLLIEVLCGVESFDLAREVHRGLRRVETGDGPRPGAAGKQGLPGGANVVPNGRHEPEAGDRDAPGHYFPILSRRYCMACPTVRSFSASSSGISMSNSFSNAITSSTVSRLSAPRSSMKLASPVSFSRSTPSSSTMMSLTFSSTLLMSAM